MVFVYKRNRIVVFIVALLVIGAICVVVSKCTKSGIARNNYDWSCLQSDGDFKSYVDEKGNAAKLGIDVSYHNKDTSWSSVAYSGIDFVYVRCGWRGYTEGEIHTDPMAVINIEGAQSQGLGVGVYFFSQALSKKEAVEEANFTCDFADAYGLSTDYPIAFDMEYNDVENERIADLTTKERTNIALAFCSRVEKRGYQAIIYGNDKWLNGYYDLETISKAYPLWLAEYSSYPDVSYDFKMWQYASDATIDGCSGTYDINLFWQ